MNRPKIQLVRLTSAEKRTFPPLNLVQLCVNYTHRRMETYSNLVSRCVPPPPPPPAVEPRCPKCVKRRRSCVHLTDGSKTPIWGRIKSGKVVVKSLENVTKVGRHPDGTKSCENILQVRQQPLAGEGRQRSPLAWREATRSEEHLAGGEPGPPAPRELRAAKSHDYLRKYTIDGSGDLVPLSLGTLSQSVPGSLRGLWGKSCTMPNMQRCGKTRSSPPPGKPRRTLSSFLKRLHPRLLRNSLQGGAPERRPWIVVEFQDVDGDRVEADRASIQSSEELRTSFSSAQKISLVRSSQSSRTELDENLLDAMRQGRVTTQTTDSVRRQRHSPKNTTGTEGVGDTIEPQRPPPNGAMFAEKEVLRGAQLTSARIIMDAQNELRTNGSSPDQVDRATFVQKRLQQTQALKTSLKSSEVVKQAVRLLSEERNAGTAPHKRPSYVGISCSVSGYSNLNRYSTRACDGLQWSQSRDSSPARTLRSLSRDSSPPVTSPASVFGSDNDASLSSPSRVSLIKRQLREGGRLTDERGRDGHRTGKQEQPRSLSVDRGYLKHYRLETARRANGDVHEHRPAMNNVANGSAKHVERSTVTTTMTARNGTTVTQTTERVEVTSDSPPDGIVSRSFVQARIERLYGPGALCSGFRRHTSNLNRSLPNRTSSEQPEDARQTPSRRPPPLQMGGDALHPDATPPPPSPGLPVFRHLRAEFRQQLPVKSRRAPVAPPADTSPTQTAVPPITAADPPLISDADRPLSEPDPKHADAEPKPGHNFLQVLDTETTRILAMATRCENDLNSLQLSTEVEGKLRAAKGKAHLLIAQKFQQFRGLCEKNIKQPADDPFPTTGDDLQGFWDMVLIQVHHIDTIMAELDTIRQNNWVIPEVSPPPREVSSASSTPNSKTSTPSSRRSTPSDPAKAEAAKARTAARKKMMEQRRKLIEEKRRAAKAAANGNVDMNGVEIFMTEDK